MNAVIDRTKAGEIIPDSLVKLMIDEDRFLRTEARKKEEQLRKRRRRERSHRAAPTEEDARARNESERREAEDEAKQIAHQVIRGLGVGETGEVVRAIRGSMHAFMLFMVLEQLEAALEQAGTTP